MSSSAVVSSSTVSSSLERFIGRVKWFNNKAGYGFVTVTDGSKSGSDVFVHHSSIKVDSEQYKYLVQGEYVEFNLSDTKTSDHEFQAGEVCGIKGGKLMCETRRDLRVARYQYRSNQSVEDEIENVEPVKLPRSIRAPSTSEPKTPRVRGQGPRAEGAWTHVVNKNKVVEPQVTSSSQKPAVRGRGRPPRAGRGEGR